MKYSLWSLMVVVTLVCVVLGSVMGRVEYLRRWAVYHERLAEEEEARTGHTGFHTLWGWHQADIARKYRDAMIAPWTTVYEPTEELEEELEQLKKSKSAVPNSQAPAPNSPKNQSGPDNDP